MSLTDALAAEHAAIYGYGVVGAFLDAQRKGLAMEAEAAHRARRDALVLRLAAQGASAPPAEARYGLPDPVTDPPSALKLAIALEERTAAAWRAALLAAEGDDRRLAVDALTDCAVRATRFRRAAGVAPAIVPFPGRS